MRPYHNYNTFYTPCGRCCTLSMNLPLQLSLACCNVDLGWFALYRDINKPMIGEYLFIILRFNRLC